MDLDSTGNMAFKEKKSRLLKDIKKGWQLYLLLVIPVAYYLIFKYYPMYGAQIAFRKYSIAKGIWGSEWVGLMYFDRIFSTPQFLKLMYNTLAISVYSIVAGFPFPILFALALNYTKNRTYKKTVQTITYVPHFISTVVIVGMLIQFLSLETGAINVFLNSLGLEQVNFMGRPEYFRHVYVWSGLWQNVGYSSIIYMAALTGVDSTLHEAATVDGANVFKRIWHIDIPGILPTIVIIQILTVGMAMSIGFEKIFLMQNPLNITVSEVVQTYIYKVGVVSQVPSYSFSTAMGLCLSVINLVLIVSVNKLSKYLSENTLW